MPVFRVMKTLNDNTAPFSYRGQIKLSKIDELFSLVISNQITISMHIASLMKIH